MAQRSMAKAEHALDPEEEQGSTKTFRTKQSAAEHSSAQRTLVKWMTLEERAAPTKPWGWEGSCRKRVSRGISPSGPSLMVCTTSRFSQSQNVSVSPYAVGTSAGLKPCEGSEQGN